MSEQKTKEDILDDCMRVELGPGEFVYTEDALQAMQLYADQQTSLFTQQLTEKDKEIEGLKKGRFKLPEDKQMIEIAILFNDGKINTKKLSDMVGMCQFVVDRLYENGDISKVSSKEQDQEDTGDPEAWSGGFADNH
jgi:hypothetical protein